MKASRLVVSVLILVSAGFAAFQSFRLSEARSDLAILREQRDNLIATRNFMLSMFLRLNRGMSKAEVESVIRSVDKKGNIEVSDNLISYDVLHFWFERDSLTSVDYGS
jgi:hypothetical protein